MLNIEFESLFENSHKGCSFDDKIHQMIWSCSLLKWISVHALGFSYGDQIRKISISQNRRKILFCTLKTEKWLSDACIKFDAYSKDDARMAWHGMAWNR